MNEVQVEQTMNWLFAVRDKVLERAKLKPTDKLIDIGTGTGLLSFKAAELLKGTGKTIGSDAFIDCLEECKKIAKDCELEDYIEFLHTDATDIKLADNSVDVVVMRSVLVHILDKQKSIKEFYRILNDGGRISIFEPVINTNTKYFELVDPETFPNYERIRAAELDFMTSDNDALTNFTQDSLVKNFEIAGFKNIDLDLQIERSTYIADESMIEPWFNSAAGSGNRTMKERFLDYLSEEEVLEFMENLKKHLHKKEITLKSYSAYISAEK